MEIAAWKNGDNGSQTSRPGWATGFYPNNPKKGFKLKRSERSIHEWDAWGLPQQWSLGSLSEGEGVGGGLAMSGLGGSDPWVASLAHTHDISWDSHLQRRWRAVRHHALAGVTEDCAFGYLWSYIDNLLLIPLCMLGALMCTGCGTAIFDTFTAIMIFYDWIPNLLAPRSGAISFTYTYIAAVVLHFFTCVKM